MGQQQLLSLVLCIVIVGATVVAGAHVFGWQKHPHNHDRAFQEALTIVTDIQLWKIAPGRFGGGAEVQGFEDLTFRQLDYSHVLLSNRVHKTENGCFRIHTTGEQQYAVLTISSPSCSARDYVAHVIIRGADPGDLAWQYVPPSSFDLFQR